MRQSFLIPHRLPGLNEWAGRKTRWHYGKLKTTTQASIEAAIRQSALKPMPFAYVSCIWFEPNRKRDLDNIASAIKFVLDSLVNCKILPNDGWEHVLGLQHDFVEHGTGSVQVTLRDKR